MYNWRILGFTQRSLGVNWALIRRSLGVHLAFTWRSLGVHLAFTWRSLGIHLAFTWRSLGVYLSGFIYYMFTYLILQKFFYNKSWDELIFISSSLDLASGLNVSASNECISIFKNIHVGIYQMILIPSACWFPNFLFGVEENLGI